MYHFVSEFCRMLNSHLDLNLRVHIQVSVGTHNNYKIALCHSQLGIVCYTPTKGVNGYPILWLPSTREKLCGFNAPGHCLVHVCLLHCMRVRLRNGYTQAYVQIMQHMHTQWPDALKPKSCSLVEDNQTIDMHAWLPLAPMIGR